MKGWLNINGDLVEEKNAVIRADNRAFRYGDGIFETMKVVMGNILLKELHFERLFRGMQVLQIRVKGLINAKILEEQVLRTISKNRLSGPVRARLTMYRGEGGLYEFAAADAGYIIQVWPLSSSNLLLNDNGQQLGLYEPVRKAMDTLSNLKSNNYLPYVMAALYTKENKLNDSIILNSEQRVCDSTVANVFWIRNETIYTPPLSEGCVAGVMRANLLQTLPAKGFNVQEKPAGVEELMEADELFLTNAVNGIRWVRQFKGKEYSCQLVAKIFHSTFE
jgi:branched-chain amino acid aminotransferase